MTDKQIKTEYKRLENMLVKAQLAEDQINALNPLLENMSWQRVALDECRKLLIKEGIVCKYDNGGGQKGTRENPRFKSYVSLYRIFISSFDKFLEYLPEDQKEDASENENITVLENVIRMKKVNLK